MKLSLFLEGCNDYLRSSLNLLPVVEPKLVAKYALAHVDASSWTGAQIKAFDGSV